MRNSMVRWIVLSALAALPAGNVPAAPAETTTVHILFTNNSDGKLIDCNCRNDPFGGIAERVSLVRKYREKYPGMLLLDSGGYLGLINRERTAPKVFALMDTMKYDVWGVGDQELYQGLARFESLLGGYRGKVVSASLRKPDGGGVFSPYRIFTVGPVRIAVIGLVGPETFAFSPKESMDFTYDPPERVAASLVPVLKKYSDFIIALSQMGVESDRALAGKKTGIDLIIGGHSQTLLEKPEVVAGCRIVQAGKKGGHVGEMAIKFDGSRKPKSFSYQLLEVGEEYTIPDDIRRIVDSPGN